MDVDNVAGARSAVDHLVALGHRRIACITNAPLVYTAAQERLGRLPVALEAAGLPIDDARWRPRAPSTRRAATARWPRCSTGPTFDAVFVASDVVALGAIGAIRERALRVPDDISVVGFDDIPLAAYFDPPLTTVHLPAYELGQAAGRALLDRISGSPTMERTLLPTELIVRASTAAPRGT